MPSPFVAPYTSTKFALNGFFGTLQHELAMKKSNVSISICTLGLIDTESAMEKVRLVKNTVSIRQTQNAKCLTADIDLLQRILHNLLPLLSTAAKSSMFLHPRGVTDIPAYPATDAALNIIITGATREPELFYPWFTHTLNLIKDWFPPITNYIIQNSYNYIP